MAFFTPIDRSNWSREPYFAHYFSAVPCSYSMTVQLDVTAVKQSGKKFYPAMLYYLTKAVNDQEAFRTAFNRQGQLGIFDQMIPCYTVFHKDTHTFSTIWTPYFEDYEDFQEAYQRDMEQYGSIHQREAKPGTPDNSFSVSMIPWEHFEAFHLNFPRESHYLPPIFTMGKYKEENGRLILPLAVQVHHAVCDGYHVCQLIDRLRELIG